MHYYSYFTALFTLYMVMQFGTLCPRTRGVLQFYFRLLLTVNSVVNIYN